jgi:hypothetical protein
MPLLFVKLRRFSFRNCIRITTLVYIIYHTIRNSVMFSFSHRLRFIKLCNPRSQSRLHCCHVYMCRIVFPYFTVYDIAVGHHCGMKV